jgi:hypothetical protein
MSEFIAQCKRNLQDNLQSKWTLIGGGLVLMAIGAVSATVRHDVSRGAFSIILGLAMLFLVVTENFLQASRLRWGTRIASVGMWSTALWLAFAGR